MRRVDHRTNVVPTNRHTNQRTNQQTSYRVALAHLKRLQRVIVNLICILHLNSGLEKKLLECSFFKGMDGSLKDHLSISLTIKSISWYLQRLRVIPWLDHYHVGIYFAPYRLKREWFIETLNNIVIPGRVNLVLPFRQPNKPVYALYTHWLTSNLASWMKG